MYRNMKEVNSIKTLSGIDSLYYFLETKSEQYQKVFEEFKKEVLDLEKLAIEYETKKQLLSAEELAKEGIVVKEHPVIEFNGHEFFYLGKAKGFYWIELSAGGFKAGLKSSTENIGLNDIQIQLLASGIYSAGVKDLVEYIDDVFYPLITDKKPITRVDLNCFIQYDLSFIDRTMFVSKKKKYTDIYKEQGSGTVLETLYVGRSPFKLRIYDKIKELKNSPKKELMEIYFIVNGFKLTQPIFNIEFEIKRDFLKTYKLLDVDSVLANAQTLFKKSTEMICLKDVPKDSEPNEKYNAPIHPIWEHIGSVYNVANIEQKQDELEAIKKRRLEMTPERAILELMSVFKYYINGGVHLDAQLLSSTLNAVKESMDKRSESKAHDKTKERYEKYLKDGQDIEPVRTITFARLSDCVLKDEYASLKSTKEGIEFFPYEDSKKQKDALNDISLKIEFCIKELQRRGLKYE